MTGVPTYRQLAEKTLGQAAAELNGLPAGRIPTDTVIANAAKTQATAAIAAVQALLEIGDVLRANQTTWTGPDDLRAQIQEEIAKFQEGLIRTLNEQDKQ
ncbi:hypothetical protein [Streptomyces sp. SAS_275]|uniref:hypothetical protein n=1 Tax=Streptomyces sp. SAS_275 TaxID=3412746 RepID=UPI00403C1DEC